MARDNRRGLMTKQIDVNQPIVEVIDDEMDPKYIAWFAQDLKDNVPVTKEHIDYLKKLRDEDVPM